jgi:ribosomal protein S15P/S13E
MKKCLQKKDKMATRSLIMIDNRSKSLLVYCLKFLRRNH